MTKANEKESFLPAELHGVVFDTGLRGIGKTLFALQADRPANIVFLDYESKGATWHEQLQFGAYVDVPAEVAARAKTGKNPTARDQWLFVQEFVDKLEPNTYTTCIIDTVGDFERSLAAEIQYQPALYGVKQSQQGGGFGGIYPAMSLQVTNFLAKLDSKGIRLVVAVAHTKPAWASSGPVPNKLRPHGCNAWHDRSILELVLIPGEGAVPAALVQKEQLAKVEIDLATGLFTVKRRLPLRLPQATWGAIRGYLEVPADLVKPKSGEVPTDDERGPYSEFFNKEQMEYLIKANQAKPEVEVVEG